MSPDLDHYLASLRHYLDAQVALKSARSELQRYLEESARVGKHVHFTGLEHASEDATHAADAVFMDAECWPSAARLQSLSDTAADAEQRARSAYARMGNGEREMVSYPFSMASHH